MVKIRCSKCRKVIFKYHKVGKGRILRCYKERIKADYSLRKGDRIMCECGNLIGVDEGTLIRMRQSAFERSGTTAKSLKK